MEPSSATATATAVTSSSSLSSSSIEPAAAMSVNNITATAPPAPSPHTTTTTTSSNNISNTTSNNSNNNNKEEGERPVWSSRLAYAGALLSLQVSQFWRGAGVVGGPHNYHFWASMCALLLCLLAIGMPLLILELGLGQRYSIGGIGMWQLPQYTTTYYRGGSSSRSARHKRQWTGLGVAGMVLGFCVASYSVGILAWTCHALVDMGASSIVGVGHHHNETLTVVLEDEAYINATTTIVANSSNPQERQYQPSPQEQQHVTYRDYFVQDIIGQSTLDVDSLSPTRLVGENVLFAGLIWLLIFALSSVGGIRLVGRASLVLTSLSLLLLLSVCVGSMTIPSPPSSLAATQTATYDNDFYDAIDHGDILSQSMIQTLYITCTLIGVLSSYASHAPSTKEPTAQIAAAVMALNTLVVFITGYAISRALDATTATTAANSALTTTLTGPPIMVDSLSTTLFVVLVQWPAALATLTNGIVWVRLLYSVFILLGLQLPIAVVTAMVTVIREDRTCGIARWKITGIASLLGFATSLLFATDAGLIFLDTIDYYLSLALILLAFLESFAAGWIYDLDDQISSYGAKPIICYMLWNFTPVIGAATIWFGFDNSDPNNYHRMWLGLFGAIVIFLFFYACTFVFIRASYEQYVSRALASSGNERIMDPRLYYMEFCFGNTESLKRSLEPSIGPLPQIWFIFIKRVVPHLLLLVFIKRLLLPSEAAGYDTVAFGNYGGYPMHPYQLTGIVLFSLIIGLFLLGFVAPQVYAPLVPPPTSVFINRRDTWEDVEDTAAESSEESTTTDDPPIEELPDMDEPVVLEDIDWEDDDDAYYASESIDQEPFRTSEPVSDDDEELCRPSEPVSEEASIDDELCQSSEQVSQEASIAEDEPCRTRQQVS